MANIGITDGVGVIANAGILDTSVLGKTSASVLKFLKDDVIHVLDQPIDKVQINTVSLGFSYQPSFPLDGGTATFTGGGSLTGEIDLYQPAKGPSSPLFSADQFGTDIEMGANVYAVLSFQVGVVANADAAPGAFTVSMADSASATAKLYLPFGPDATGTYPTLRACLQTLVGAYRLPNGLSDFDSWPVGTIFTIDCQGSAAFTGSVDVLVAVNPTATPGFSSTAGPISITAGPSLAVQGGFTLTGEFQTRFWKQDKDHVQLGYYKKRGTSLSVGFDASAGVDVTVFGFDVISKVYSLLGDSGILDATWLKNNVEDSVAEEVGEAYKAAVQTKLSIAVDAECDSSVTDEVAFSWSFTSDKPSVAAQNAFDAALKADLTLLLGGAPLPDGVFKVGSLFDRTTDVKHTFTLNFLGLYDHANVHEAVLDLNTKVSVDGQLIMTDQAHLDRLAADATPFIKSAPLQKVFAEDCTATVGYAASVSHYAPQLEVKYTYYDFLNRASAADLTTFLATAAVVLEEDPSHDWLSIVHQGTGKGAASFLATLSYKATQASALFLDAAGESRREDDYEHVGRQALLATPGLDLNNVFEAALKDDEQWAALVDAGARNNILALLREDVANPSVSAQVAVSWISYVRQWAPAMHSAGVALKAVSDYVKANPEADLLNDDDFHSLRRTFASQFKTAIQKAESLFNDALGLITIYDAATPTAKTVTITYKETSKTYQ